MVVSTTVEDYATKFEQEFYLVSIDYSVGRSIFQHLSINDNGETKHMTGIYDTFHIVMKLRPGQYIQLDIDCPQMAI